MSRTGLMGIYVAIFVVIGSALGALEHASKMDPSGVVDQGHVAIHGIAVSPFKG